MYADKNIIFLNIELIPVTGLNYARCRPLLNSSLVGRTHQNKYDEVFVYYLYLFDLSRVLVLLSQIYADIKIYELILQVRN